MVAGSGRALTARRCMVGNGLHPRQIIDWLSPPPTGVAAEFSLCGFSGDHSDASGADAAYRGPVSRGGVDGRATLAVPLGGFSFHPLAKTLPDAVKHNTVTS